MSQHGRTALPLCDKSQAGRCRSSMHHAASLYSPKSYLVFPMSDSRWAFFQVDYYNQLSGSRMIGPEQGKATD